MPPASQQCEHNPRPRDKHCKHSVAERARTRKRTTLLSSAISQCQRPIRCCARSLLGSSSSAVTACCRAICTDTAVRQLSRRKETSSKQVSCGHGSMSGSSAVTACCRAICTDTAARQLSRKEETSSRRVSCGHGSISSSSAITAQGTLALLCLSSTAESRRAAQWQHKGSS